MISFTDSQLQTWVVTLLWPLARILALISVAPVFGESSLPQRAKIGLALALTVTIVPALGPVPRIDPVSIAGLAALAQQVLIGTAMGFAMRLVFAAVESAGEIIALQMGLGFATLYDPQNADSVSAPGSLMNALAVLMFLSIDGHLAMLAAVIDSFRTLPIDAGPVPSLSIHMIVAAGANVLAAGSMLALPIVAALMLTNLALGVLSRAAPQLNLFAVGFPVTLAVGLVLLAVMLPRIAPVLAGMLDHASEVAAAFADPSANRRPFPAR